MLIAENLSFAYPKGSTILENVHLQLQEGEMLGIFADSGCGKTTLARLLSGYLSPRQGQVLFQGSPLPRKGVCPVQMVFQNPETAVNPRLKIRQILEEGGPLEDLPWRALFIEPGWLERYPTEISPGELQRVTLARALGPKTRVLIADEATSMLDPPLQAVAWEVISHFLKEKRGAGVVLSHDLQLLERVCEQVRPLSG